MLSIRDGTETGPELFLSCGNETPNDDGSSGARDDDSDGDVPSPSG
jgi:hypothetical protein